MTERSRFCFDLMIALPHNNSKNLELESPQCVAATVLDQLDYTPNCYIQLFSDTTLLKVGHEPTTFNIEVQHATNSATDLSIYFFIISLGTEHNFIY